VLQPTAPSTPALTPRFAARLSAGAMSADAASAISGAMDGTLRVWDLNSKQQMSALVAHTEPINAVAFSPTDPLILSASGDKTIRLWAAHDGRIPLTVWETPSDRFDSVSVSRDGRIAAYGGDSGDVRIVDIATAKLLRLHHTQAAVRAILFVHEDQQLA